MWANEGRCIHEVSLTVGDPNRPTNPGDPSRLCFPIELTLLMVINPAGREVEPAGAVIIGQESTIEQSQLLALKLSEIVRRYRGSAGRRLG